RSANVRTIFRRRTTSWNSITSSDARSYPDNVRMAPARVQIVEVSPRDGLQAEERTLSTATKLELLDRLADAGHTVIEATSFVSPGAVPQLADADVLMTRLRRRPGVRYAVLVPNARGLERALAAGVTEIAVLVS